MTKTTSSSRLGWIGADRNDIARIQQEAPGLAFEQAELLHQYRYGRTLYLCESELRAAEALESRLAEAKAATAIPLRRTNGDGYERSERSGPAPEPTKIEPLTPLDISNWDDDDVPQRDWAVRDRIIRRAVTLLSGEGGVGKSILTLQLACAHALARDWFMSLPAPGSAFYLDAEDDEPELHFRLNDIRDHFGVTFKDLYDGGLHLMPLAGKDALLGVPDRGGIIRPTPLFERLLLAATIIQPVLIVVNSAADVFAGNENSRTQVRQFIGLLRHLAITANAAVLLASHPSLTGISTDSGLSGSTAWNNSVRSRLFFKTASDSDDDRTGERELIVRKSNYGPTGEVVRMVWRNGVFVPVATPSSMERAAAERTAEDLFMKLFDLMTCQGQMFSPHATSPINYPPRRFAKHRDANRTSEAAFADAMQRLLDAGTIRVETSGPPSKPRARLVRT